jgi:plasmid stabilization system protein ParE
MLRRLRLSARAVRDIRSILEWSELSFGEAASERYARVLRRAVDQLRWNEEIDWSTPVEELPSGVFVYHLQRARVGASGRVEVKHPRHFLVCRWGDAQDLLILAVLHDGSDLAGRLSEPWIDSE